MKITHISLIIAFLLLSSCETAEIIIFSHEQSQIYNEKGDINLKELKPFCVNGSLLTIDVRHVTHEDLLIWLGVSSEKVVQSMRVINASILNLDMTKKMSIDSIEMVMDSNDCDNTNSINECSIKLFEKLSLNKLETFTEKNGFKILVTFEINGNKDEKIFKIDRRVEKYVTAISQ